MPSRRRSKQAVDDLLGQGPTIGSEPGGEPRDAGPIFLDREGERMGGQRRQKRRSPKPRPPEQFALPPQSELEDPRGQTDVDPNAVEEEIRVTRRVEDFREGMQPFEGQAGEGRLERGARGMQELPGRLQARGDVLAAKFAKWQAGELPLASLLDELPREEVEAYISGRERSRVRDEQASR